MSGNFTTNDVLAEAEKLLPKEVTVDRIGNFISGDSFIAGIVATVFRLITSDPDSLYYLITEAAKTVSLTAKLVLSDLLLLNQLLDSVGREPAYVSGNHVAVVSDAFTALKSGSLNARKRKLAELDRKIKLMVANTALTSGVNTNKSPQDVAYAVDAILQNTARRLAAMQALSDNVLLSIVSYMNSGAFLRAADNQIDEIVSRLGNLPSSNGASSTTALLTAAVGLSLVEERLTVRLPYAAKYTGGLAWSPRFVAGVAGDKSFPLSAGASTVSLTLNAAPVTITVPAAKAAKLVTLPFTLKPGTVDDAFPVTSVGKLTLNVDNTDYVVTTANPLASLSALVTAINLAVPTITASASSGALTLTHNSLGSAHRIMLLDSSSLGAGQVDLNVLLGLNSSRYHEAVGSDTVLSNLTASDPALVRISSTEVVLAKAVAGTSSGSTIVLAATVGVMPGDKVLIGKSYYPVTSVVSDTVTVGTTILQNQTDAGAKSWPTAFTFIREGAVVSTMDSASSNKLSVVASNDLGLPVGDYYPQRDEFVLTGPVELGSPIRVGDVILDDVTNMVVGSVATISSGRISATVLAAPEKLTTITKIRIMGLGAFWFNSNFSKLKEAKTAISTFPSINNFMQKVNVFVASGSNRNLIDEDLVGYLSGLGLVSSVYGNAEANSSQAMMKLVKLLNENRLTVIAKILTGLEFQRLYGLQTKDLSDVAAISGIMGQLADEFGNGKSLVTLTASDSIWSQTPVQETPLLEYPGVAPEE